MPFRCVLCVTFFFVSGVSRARLVCTGIVLVGLFISLEPEIFNIQVEKSDEVSEKSDSDSLPSAIWPFIFVLGFLPLGILNTFIEKQLKKDEVSGFPNHANIEQITPRL